MCRFLSCLKWISRIFILIFLFVLCCLIGVRWFFAEDGNFAWAITHIELVKSYPLTPYIKEIALGIISFMFLSYIALRYWKISIFCCLLVVIVVLGKWHFFQRNSSIFSQEYLTPQTYLPNNVLKRNLIVISLEGIENIFAIDDITKSGNLLPNLSLLREEGIIFDGYVDIVSMRPTIPSFFAKNCGIPSRTNDMNIYNRWVKETDYTQFPNAKCVFDILRNTGYKTYYMMGANLTDEGAASFFEYHPPELALGRLELLKNGVSQRESRYMIPDSELYKYAKTILSNSQNRPFGLYIVTGNTHAVKKGGYYVENGCENIFGDFRDAIQCLDKVTYDFIKWCQSQTWYKDTVIYLIGDHLMRNSDLRVFPNDVKKYPRQVFALMLNGKGNAETINRKYTQVDFAPTILESLGFVHPALGLGRSLFRDDSTLVEKFGRGKLESEIQSSWNDFQNVIHKKTFATEVKKTSIARIDITTPLVDANVPQFEVYVDDSKTLQQQAEWMPKFDIQGYVVQEDDGIKNIKLKALKSGDISIVLRGPDKRDEKNNIIENWVTFTSMKINGEEILPTSQSVWHNKPFRYIVHAKVGEVYKIEVEWQ